MALIPNINLCIRSGCTEFVFRETTGVYNVTTNPGGYGSPNSTLGSIVSAALTVTSPDNISYLLDLMDLDAFPSSNEDYEYILPLSSLGGRTVIEDGEWQFTYVVNDGSSNYSVIKTYFFYCNAECCASKMLSAISITGMDDVNNPINNKNIDKYTRVRTLISSIKGAANCGNETQFNKILTLINRFCRNTDCKTCN